MQQVIFAERPIFDELVLLSDVCALLDLLPTNLPLHLTVPRIDSDIFWLRCYKERWPLAPPKGKRFSETVQLNVEDNTNSEETHFDEQNSREESSKENDNGESVCSDKKSIRSRIIEGTVSKRRGEASWKQCFLEEHLRETLESTEPGRYNVEKVTCVQLLVFKVTHVKLKQLLDLCKDHVKKLRIRHQISSTKSEEKVPLITVLQSLPLLSELCICFKQVNKHV